MRCIVGLAFGAHPGSGLRSDEQTGTRSGIVIGSKMDKALRWW